MLYEAIITFQGIKQTIQVESAGHGQQWAETRAISAFLYQNKITRPEKSFKLAAAAVKAEGLKISMKELDPETPYFVMLQTQNGRLCPMMDPENVLYMYASPTEAEKSAKQTFYGKNFGYEIFCQGEGLKISMKELQPVQADITFVVTREEASIIIGSADILASMNSEAGNGKDCARFEALTEKLSFQAMKQGHEGN